jgi:hypothetical protein
MKTCPYCGYANYDGASACRKCDGSFIVVQSATVYQDRPHRISPARAKAIRSQALTMIVLGLLIKVYWGGYGPWPTIDFPILATLRVYLEPLLIFGGAALYAFGLLASVI